MVYTTAASKRNGWRDLTQMEQERGWRAAALEQLVTVQDAEPRRGANEAVRTW